jgi:hypothetical protein
MSYETLWWKLFPFSLIRKAKHWYRHHVKRSKENWDARSSSFRLQFFPIYKVIKLCVELLTFKQQKNKPLGKAWERFNTLVDSSPNLALAEPILL